MENVLVVFGLLVLRSGLPRGNKIFYLTAIVITVSIFTHSSNDVLVARWLKTKVPTEPATSDEEHD